MKVWKERNNCGCKTKKLEKKLDKMMVQVLQMNGMVAIEEFSKHNVKKNQGGNNYGGK